MDGDTKLALLFLFMSLPNSCVRTRGTTGFTLLQRAAPRAPHTSFVVVKDPAPGPRYYAPMRYNQHIFTPFSLYFYFSKTKIIEAGGNCGYIWWIQCRWHRLVLHRAAAVMLR